MSEIIKGKLFLGSFEDAINEKWLQTNSIQLVITVMNEPKMYIEQINSITCCKHYTVSVSDMTFENVLENIHEICSWIDSVDTVLVHCMHGISRSATIVLAYIMLKLNLHFDDATRMVLKKRNYIFPNDGFITQLINLEKTIFGLMTYLPDKDGLLKYKRLLHGYD
jgi:predicted protein tyrosine phosphatase